jgi:membrane-bound lytic murein transglycosylase A
MNKFILLLFLSALTACAARVPLEKPELAMRPSGTPFLEDDLYIEDYMKALSMQADSLYEKKQNMVFGLREINSADYAAALYKIIDVWEATRDREETLAYISKNFDFLEVYGGKKWGEVLITAYFEPVIHGSLKPTGRFTQALYKRPPDLVSLDLEPFDQKFTNERKLRGRLVNNKLVPYYTREEIVLKKVLAGKGLEICYVDPVDAFFLHIQGSGVVRLEDGKGGEKDLILNFAEKNGHTYHSIGKFLDQYIPKNKMTLKNIETYLKTLPEDQLQQALILNPSFVFFKIAEQNAITSSGLPATAGRTIATDKRFFPEGSMAYLEFDDPEITHRKIRRLVIDQDTGGAITGGGRVDLFWGRGDDAKYVAGRIKNPGKLYYLFPKQ